MGFPLILRARSRRDKNILCPHVRQTSPMSAPTRTTCHSDPPQGWDLRMMTRSFTSIFSICIIIKHIVNASLVFRKTRIGKT